jgi:cysteinyl-tRNA synthetase
LTVGAAIRFFNSMGRQAGEFSPLFPGRVGLYTCGLTVYADPHLGNMRPYVFSDTLRRMLEWKGLTVTQVVNITDVGHAVGDIDLAPDKVEEAARAELRSVQELTDHYAQLFYGDLEQLNVLPHQHSPRASMYVPRMIEFAKALDAHGYTYQLSSGLYFDTSRSPGYGRLALLPQGDGHARIEEVAGKRSAADFAVWRADLPGEQRIMHWDSPWGVGVPGWHLECSVMSMDLLGEHFDIHTGGVDHRELHHVNEIAQSEAYLRDGREWVPWWLHNEFLVLGGQKIAKSAGRMPTLRDLTSTGFHPLAFRYFLLTAHYRSQQDLTEAALRSAAAAYRRLLGRAASLRPLPDVAGLAGARRQLGGAARDALDRIDEAISDDLSTPRVLAELQRVLRDETLTERDRGVLVAASEQVLGLRLGEINPEQVTGRVMQLSVPSEYIEQLVAERDRARQARDWPAADRLRAQLFELGVRVVDTPSGSRWEPEELTGEEE